MANNPHDKNIKAAIIGYFLNGMPIEAICYYSDIEYYFVSRIILEWLEAHDDPF